MNHLPTLADIEPRRIKFQPGDRVIVRVNCHYAANQAVKMHKAINKMAGCEIRTIIVDCTKTSVVSPRLGVLCGPEHAQAASGLPGVANVSMGIVGLQAGDRVEVAYHHYLPPWAIRAMEQQWRQWTGADVEVVVVALPK